MVKRFGLKEVNVEDYEQTVEVNNIVDRVTFYSPWARCSSVRYNYAHSVELRHVLSATEMQNVLEYKATPCLPTPTWPNVHKYIHQAIYAVPSSTPTVKQHRRTHYYEFSEERKE